MQMHLPACSATARSTVDYLGVLASTTPAGMQVMAETGGSTAVAFDQIDKAPEEKARGITISTAHGALSGSTRWQHDGRVGRKCHV